MIIRMRISGAGEGQETKPNEDDYRLEAVTERDTMEYSYYHLLEGSIGMW